MAINAYACSYCGEFILAEGGKIPLESNKCKKCGASKYIFVADRETYSRFASRGELWVLTRGRCRKYEDAWEEHNKNLTPTSGEKPEYTSTYSAPRCPTCGSIKIKRITSAERGANAIVFGFLGNKRRYQFQCLNPNCKYLW